MLHRPMQHGEEFDSDAHSQTGHASRQGQGDHGHRS